MFSNNITLKATLAAEKEKERADNRLAARYLKIRALLDEAEKAINSANIARSLKNQLISKLLKARRALDKGLNVEEVIEMMTLIVTIINHHIKLDKKAIDVTTSEMRRDLDTFYNFPKPKQSSTTTGTTTISKHVTVRSRSTGSWGSAGGQEANLETVKEEESKAKLKEKSEESEDETAAVELSSKRDETGHEIDSLVEDEEELADDPVKQHTLETLVTSLNILQEIPKLKLNKNQQNYIGPTMRATKPLLRTTKGCSALAGPLNMLKTAIDSKTDGKPVEPLFTQALVEMNIVISSFEYAERKLVESKSENERAQ